MFNPRNYVSLSADIDKPTVEQWIRGPSIRFIGLGVQAECSDHPLADRCVIAVTDSVSITKYPAKGLAEFRRGAGGFIFGVIRLVCSTAAHRFAHAVPDAATAL